MSFKIYKKYILNLLIKYYLIKDYNFHILEKKNNKYNKVKIHNIIYF